MHGVKIPDTATPDDKPSEELPYMEMLYRFCVWPEILLQPRNNQRRKAARLARGVWVSRDRARFLVQVRAPAPLLHDAAFFGRGEGTQHVKKRKDT